MSQERYEKDYGPVDRARDTAGIYRLGFEKSSFLGFALPWVIVGGIGGVLGFIIWQLL